MATTVSKATYLLSEHKVSSLPAGVGRNEAIDVAKNVLQQLSNYERTFRAYVTFPVRICSLSSWSTSSMEK